MQALLVSTGVVALAEIGDKTQLLAFVLAARYRRPWPIVAGILVATVLNHALAGAAGAWLMAVVSPTALRWTLGLSFLAMAAWALKPDTLDDDDARPRSGHGVFAVTLVAFFLAEMGDKTQFATIALAAATAAPIAVVAGTTIGMMLANVPAVWLGERLLRKVPLRLVHAVAAGVFALLGAATLLGAGSRFGL
jgi:putative Ca2+/H+ antiporter (TMEM165/GDT1 family)